jgi:hypothetical protein
VARTVSTLVVYAPHDVCGAKCTPCLVTVQQHMPWGAGSSCAAWLLAAVVNASIILAGRRVGLQAVRGVQGCELQYHRPHVAGTGPCASGQGLLLNVDMLNVEMLVLRMCWTKCCRAHCLLYMHMLTGQFPRWIAMLFLIIAVVDYSSGKKVFQHDLCSAVQLEVSDDFNTWPSAIRLSSLTMNKEAAICRDRFPQIGLVVPFGYLG